jgi:SAM-dependent methyltransferase
MHRAAHRRLVFQRRRRRLATALLDALPDGPGSVLDVGCGSGEIGADIVAAGHRVVGVEVLARRECAIPLVRFDGRRLPFADGSFDHAVVVDVLHHTADPDALLGEARRVTSGSVVVKDHFAESGLDRVTLGLMDWVGNRQFGVGRSGRYHSRAEWSALFHDVGLVPERVVTSLDLYPAPVDLVFERNLHFVARLVDAPGFEPQT